MRATILFFALTVLVAVSGVWWVNSRSPVEEEHVAQVEPPIAAEVDAGSIEAKQREWREAVQADRGGSAVGSDAGGRQLAAEQTRVDRGLKGCYASGSRCRCIGADNQPVRVSVETCRLVASEPPTVER